MTRPSIKHALIILTIFVALTIAGVTVGVIIPSIRLILSVRHDVQDTEGSLEQEYKETRILRRSIREVGDISKQMDIYKQAFIHEGDELKIITELENIANAHHIDQTLQVDKTSPKPGEKNTGPAYVFSFNNRGTFINHLQYLHALEQLPYYMNIDALIWEKTKSTADTQTLNIKFLGRIPILEKDL